MQLHCVVTDHRESFEKISNSCVSTSQEFWCLHYGREGGTILIFIGCLFSFDLSLGEINVLLIKYMQCKCLKDLSVSLMCMMSVAVMKQDFVMYNYCLVLILLSLAKPCVLLQDPRISLWKHSEKRKDNCWPAIIADNCVNRYNKLRLCLSVMLITGQSVPLLYYHSD